MPRINLCRPCHCCPFKEPLENNIFRLIDEKGLTSHLTSKHGAKGVSSNIGTRLHVALLSLVHLIPVEVIVAVGPQHTLELDLKFIHGEKIHFNVEFVVAVIMIL